MQKYHFKANHNVKRITKAMDIKMVNNRYFRRNKMFDSPLNTPSPSFFSVSGA